VTNAVGIGAIELASMRGHLEIVQLLSGSGAVRERDPIPAIGARIETGIRAIDLLVPLAPGMVVRVHGAAETGMMVLLAELTRRFGDAGMRSSWVGPQPRELETLAAELGISDCTTIGLDPIERAVFLFPDEGQEAENEAMLPRLSQHAAIVFVVDPWMAVTRGDLDPPTLRAPYRALIRTSRALAEEGIYPAIDPASDSLVAVDGDHERIRAWVRANFDLAKAELAQPFYTWQHKNGLRGEVTPLAETLARLDRLSAA
jgi:hypothetical protein